MIGLRNLSLGALLAWACFGPAAMAQTPANIAVVSGNGQLVCRLCSGSNFTLFEPMVVLVTDSQGHAVPSTPVNWAVVGGATQNTSLNAAQTSTANDGTTSNVLTIIFTTSRVAYTVVASLPNSTASVTFTLTAGGNETSTDFASAQVSPSLPVAVAGPAGGAGSPALKVTVTDQTGKGIQNISVRLIPSPNQASSATAACATGAGADPGSVLTDITGLATCTPNLGPVTGTATYLVLVGGVANGSINVASGPIGYVQFVNPVIVQVTAGTPGMIKMISGSGQSANAGQSLASPLVAEVDSSTGNPISGAAVTWSVSPAGAATLGSSTSTSDANGRVSNTATLSSTASGIVQITASAGNSETVVFSVTVNTTITGLTKVSGDAQTAIVGTAFSQPLVVQVTAASGQTVSNAVVQFTLTGPGTPTTSNVSTDSNGRASLAVTAGSTPGAITVTASIGSYSVSFSLNVAPQGPAITPSSFVNGAGFFATDSVHNALTPCGIGTVIAPGIAPGIQGVVTGPMFGPLSYLLGQVAIAFNNSLAPLYNVANVNGQQQASFQVPCDLAPSPSVPVTVTVNGNSNTVNVVVRSAGPGIFQFGDADGVQRAVVVRSDGSYASVKNPVHRGETVRVYITGMGQVQPALATNSIPALGVDSVAQGTVVVAINNSGMRVVSARRAPGLVGVDEIAFQVDPNAPVGTDVLYVAVYPADNPGAIEVSNTSWISVQ